MDQATPAVAQEQTTEHARDLQTRLYREIGISAVAAALRFIAQPDPGQQKPVQHAPLPIFRDDDMAA